MGWDELSVTLTYYGSFYSESAEALILFEEVLDYKQASLGLAYISNHKAISH